MSGNAETLLVTREWVKKAENDLRTAEHTLTLREDCPFDIICFHAQQCAEKYLKALLVARGIPPPRTHDLRILLQMIEPHRDLALDATAIASLNRYAVQARYPEDLEEFTRDDAEKALSVSRQVRGAARQNLPPTALAETP